jgi:N,N'-diacetyllegionaminate synthase
MKLFKNKVNVIAEIGGNFTTVVEAFKLIDAAKYSGVDFVKLQTFTAENITTRNAYFDMEITGKIPQFEFFKKFEINEADHLKIINYIKDKNMGWLSTPSHEDDVDLIIKLGTPIIKIGADDLTNIPLLEYSSKTNKQIILSTGMGDINEIEEAVNAITKWNKDLILLHTVSGYPTNPEHVNLRSITYLRKKFPELTIGFSDHSLGIYASLGAVALGAKVVERHFTIEVSDQFPDSKVSSKPDEMKILVEGIRKLEIMIGEESKNPIGPEIINRINNRKSVVCIKDISEGEFFTKNNIGIRRPGDGIPPKYIDNFLNKKSSKKYMIGEKLDWEALA